MLTSSKRTIEVMNNLYLNTGKINEAALSRDMLELLRTDGRLFGLLKNKRSKPTTVTFAVLIELANRANKGYYSTGRQLKNWLTEYGNGYDSVKETLNYIKNKKESAK